jgi:predicted transcriptional regulator
MKFETYIKKNKCIVNSNKLLAALSMYIDSKYGEIITIDSEIMYKKNKRSILHKIAEFLVEQNVLVVHKNRLDIKGVEDFE